jgi:putative FmdB family regulatory protein
MPIYAYRCASCGHDKDVIQKFSDTPLTLCPVCGADAFRKQLTAPSFQLKGSGWYVTDFRDQGKSKSGKPDGGKSEGEGATTAPPPSSTDGGSNASAPAAATPAASTASSSGSNSSPSPSSSNSAPTPAATPAKPAST